MEYASYNEMKGPRAETAPIKCEHSQCDTFTRVTYAPISGSASARPCATEGGIVETTLEFYNFHKYLD